MYRHRAGFSLVELSIVLVILGLLVGGVLSGQALIEAARIRAISTEVEGYRTALNTFKGKYFQPPGDINNASSFWPDCVDSGAFGQNTCNGNGDGHMGGPFYTPFQGIWGETFRAWEHLALAGLIAGSYTSPASLNAGSGYYNIYTDNLPSAGMPSSRYNGSANYFFGYTGPAPGLTCLWGTHQYCGLDVILLAPMVPMSAGLVQTNNADDASLMTPTQAYLFDLKYDDGLPLSGTVVAIQWQNPSVTCIDNSANTYMISGAAKDVHCINLMFTH